MGSPLYHLFNPKKLKVSYSTTSNMKKIFAGHNSAVLKNLEDSNTTGDDQCDCAQKGEECPLNGECHLTSLVYKADVEVGNTSKSYIGQTKKTFRERWTGHNSNIRLCKNSTTLSTYIAELKKKGVEPDSIKWSKLKQVQPRRKGEKICRLCNTEKTNIVIEDPEVLLNKRHEIMQRCRHRDDLVLTNDLCTTRPASVVAARRDLLYPPRGEEDEEEGPSISQSTSSQQLARETRGRIVDYKRYF